MPTDHKVKQGECVSSIAAKYGLFPEKVWDDPGNADLKQLRKDSNVLAPGDVLVIPDKQLKDESGGAEQRHRFRKKGVPAKLRLRLVEPQPDDDAEEWAESEPGAFDENPLPPAKPPKPLEDTSYLLYVDGTVVAEDKTDSDGWIEANIPPDAKSGRLILNPGTPQETTIELNLGQMDPVDEIPGMCKRLFNLGYEVASDADSITPDVAEALRAFQRDNELDVNGEADDATKQKLKELHGG